jgi:hypothetical protein
MGNRNYAEDPLQAGMTAYIRAVAPDCICASIPNGGYRDKREAARLRWTGLLAGMPDLIVLGPAGAVIGLEVKTPTGKLSLEQTLIAEKWKALGYDWHVVRSIDDVRRALAEAGIPTREVHHG